MRILCVLRSGGDYCPEHVLRLQAQLAAVGETDFACLSDVLIEGVETIPLRYDWPGWWAKLELFRPDLRGDFLFLDLDMSIVGPIREIGERGVLSIMRDVYRPGGLQSSIMFLPEHVRGHIWQEWSRSPEGWRARYRNGGDQAFLERFWLRKAKRLQDMIPGAIVSFKADDVQGRGIPENARVICFHGKPRPWEVGF
jgi:hypothetical protein